MLEPRVDVQVNQIHRTADQISDTHAHAMENRRQQAGKPPGRDRKRIPRTISIEIVAALQIHDFGNHRVGLPLCWSLL